jgi:hypothetical protein
MSWCIKTLTTAWLVALAACGPSAEPDVGTATEAWCRGYYTSNIVARDGTVFFISPDRLATSAEAWGPQTLSLSVDRHFAPQVSYQETPGVTLDRNKVTRSLQAAVGFSLTTDTELTAVTSVLVPTGAYYRLEAYPEYQLVNWDLRRDPCGPVPDAFVTTGAVYRPVGIYFRVMVFVGGAWNALAPPSPSELPLPPTLGGLSVPGGGASPPAGSAPAADSSGAAGASDAGASDAGASDAGASDAGASDAGASDGGT